MASIKCPVCGSMCTDTRVCTVCGSDLPVAPAPSGFGDIPQQSGFGGTIPQGFGAPQQQRAQPPQAGFGIPPQTSFGAATQTPQSGLGGVPQSGFGGAPQAPQQSPQTGFGNAPFSGFGNTPQSPTPGFGGAQQQAPPSGFGGAPQSGFGGPAQTGFGVQQPGLGGSDSARFAETVGKALSDGEGELHWGFKQCLIHLLKGLIPIYGIYLLIVCAIGNPRKFPTVITNYTRASLVLYGIIVVLFAILGVVLGSVLSTTFSALSGFSY
jgi:hypothetical protein